MNHSSPYVRRYLGSVVLGVLWLVGGISTATGQTVKTAAFDEDPKWDAVNNHIVPDHGRTVTQDFGYSSTHIAGKEAGEIGGRVTRAAAPAYYADAMIANTLNDQLSASGTFAITSTSGGAGVFFGWFNAKQPGGAGRPMNSLGMDIDAEGKGARLAVRMISGSNRSTGTFITPFRRGFRPTPIRNDGTRYTWRLTYDPAGANGAGRFEFTIKSDSDKPEEWEGKTFAVDLPPGFKEDGATFDRFGLMNLMKPGGTMNIHFGDLEYDGKAADFSKEPAGWAGSNNRARYEDTQVGAQDFGYSPNTNLAGGSAGEIGGSFWRTEKPWGYYADRVGPLSLDDRMEASGRVILVAGGPDSDMYLGWFDSTQKEAPVHAGNFLGVHVGGPTRVGHYFQPAYATAGGTRVYAQAGPVLTPGKAYEWTLKYDPATNDSKGAIQLTLGGESVTLPLRPGHRKGGAHFDHFGLFSAGPGGQMVRMYVDDLKYTAAAK